MRYVKRVNPEISVEAVYFDGLNTEDVKAFAGTAYEERQGQPVISTPSGDMRLFWGNYVLKTESQSIYVMTGKQFERVFVGTEAVKRADELGPEERGTEADETPEAPALTGYRRGRRGRKPKGE